MYGEHASFLTARIFIKHGVNTPSTDCQGHNLPLETDSQTEYVGFFGKKRVVSKHLSFADLYLPSGEVIQICSRAEDDAERHEKFSKILAHTPVLVNVEKAEATEENGKKTIIASDIKTLNEAPKNLIVTKETRFPPTKRHLQIRFHKELEARLRFRSWLKGSLNKSLISKGFTDIETPTLFKSTPEGAREFLVPTRQRGKAYALTQSPQQYKQVLMASGFGRYMQWARCYRDEDFRADRQPEFSQLDMEWAFANAENVQKDVTDIITRALLSLQPSKSYKGVHGYRVPVVSRIPLNLDKTATPAHEITHLTFAEAIERYGSDKPDLRIPGRIYPLTIPDSVNHFVSMITYLEDPLVEAFTLPVDEAPSAVRKFAYMFMENLPRALRENPDGAPQISIYDSNKPLNGFAPLGPEYETILDQITRGHPLHDGDIVVFQARKKPVGQFTDASTKIGDFRRLLWQALVNAELMPKPRLGDPGSLQFAWITEFPMFKPLAEDEPWQAEANAAGISACHHPFTAPLSQADFELLFTNPLEAKSAAYDLVLNGTEVGGGSVRNHVAEIQKFIMRDVLKMPKERIQDFRHLFDALKTGCPPHAGFALGFDRLCALLTDTATVRDVIAFPKTMKGEDVFVRSPSRVDNEKLKPYWLVVAHKPQEPTSDANSPQNLEEAEVPDLAESSEQQEVGGEPASVASTEDTVISDSTHNQDVKKDE